MRGRHSGNLYRARFDDALLERRLGDVRRELRLEQPVTTRATDVLAFAGWSLAGLVLFAVQLALSPILLPLMALRSRFARAPA